MLYFCPLERWQSGRLRRSWKPLSCEAPGVRIPPSPQDHEAKRYREIRYLLFLYLWRKFTCRRRCENKVGGLPLFAQWACKGPCGEQKGKAINGATIGSVVANPSLSALNSLQEVDFQPCRLFLCPKSCTKNAPTPFLRTSTGVSQIAHISYFLSNFLVLPSIQYNYLHIHPL